MPILASLMSPDSPASSSTRHQLLEVAGSLVRGDTADEGAGELLEAGMLEVLVELMGPEPLPRTQVMHEGRVAGGAEGVMDLRGRSIVYGGFWSYVLIGLPKDMQCAGGVEGIRAIRVLHKVGLTAVHAAVAGVAGGADGTRALPWTQLMGMW